MASLVRLLVFLAIVGGLAFAGMWALDTYVEPSAREMSEPVSLDRVLSR